MAVKTLGLLVTSDRFPDYVVHMVRAAHAKGLLVRIHMTGSAVRLMHHPEVAALAPIANISICRRSAADYQVTDHGGASGGSFRLFSDQIARFIEGCDRHVVL
jgi:hypothetical protein